MKKILLGMALISSVAMGAEKTNLYLKTGADLWQKFDVIQPEGSVAANKKGADDFGYEITAEITREIYPNLEIGAGISYQDHGSPERVTLDNDVRLNVPDLKSVPLYVTAKYNLPVESVFKPYLKTDLGYSFNRISNKFKVEDFQFQDSWEFSTKIKDGMYFGIGAGVEYNNFTADLMYKINKSQIKVDAPNGSFKEDLDYSRVTLSIGYKFNL